jgi:hypothetical protein
MVKFTLWDKVRNSVGLGYTDATLMALAQEQAAVRDAQLKAEAAKAKAVAAAKAEKEAAAKAAESKRVAEVKAAAAKTPSQPKAKATPAKKAPTGKLSSKGEAKKPLREATRDGDGDGFINDGKPNQRKVAPKKPAAPKTSTAKATPKPKK